MPTKEEKIIDTAHQELDDISGLTEFEIVDAKDIEGYPWQEITLSNGQTLIDGLDYFDLQHYADTTRGMDLPYKLTLVPFYLTQRDVWDARRELIAKYSNKETQEGILAIVKSYSNTEADLHTLIKDPEGFIVMAKVRCIADKDSSQETWERVTGDDLTLKFFREVVYREECEASPAFAKFFSATRYVLLDLTSQNLRCNFYDSPNTLYLARTRNNRGSLCYHVASGILTSSNLSVDSLELLGNKEGVYVAEDLVKALCDNTEFAEKTGYVKPDGSSDLEKLNLSRFKLVASKKNLSSRFVKYAPPKEEVGAEGGFSLMTYLEDIITNMMEYNTFRDLLKNKNNLAAPYTEIRKFYNAQDYNTSSKTYNFDEALTLVDMSNPYDDGHLNARDVAVNTSERSKQVALALKFSVTPVPMSEGVVELTQKISDLDVQQSGIADLVREVLNEIQLDEEKYGNLVRLIIEPNIQMWTKPNKEFEAKVNQGFYPIMLGVWIMGWFNPVDNILINSFSIYLRQFLCSPSDKLSPQNKLCFGYRQAILVKMLATGERNVEKLMLQLLQCPILEVYARILQVFKRQVLRFRNDWMQYVHKLDIIDQYLTEQKLDLAEDKAAVRAQVLVINKPESKTGTPGTEIVKVRETPSSEDSTLAVDPEDDYVMALIRKHLVRSSVRQSCDLRNYRLAKLSHKIDVDRLKAQRNRLLTQVDEIETRLSQLKRMNSLGTFKLISEASAKLEPATFGTLIKSSITEMVQDTASKLRQIVEFPMVKRLSINQKSRYLVIELQEVHLTDDRTNLKYNLGPINIAIPFDLSNLNYMKNCDARMVRWYSGGMGYNIGALPTIPCDSRYGPKAMPHSGERGSACLGNAELPLQKALSKGNILTAAAYAIQYAESVNTEDTWGSGVNQWKLLPVSQSQYLMGFLKTDSWEAEHIPENEMQQQWLRKFTAIPSPCYNASIRENLEALLPADEKDIEALNNLPLFENVKWTICSATRENCHIAFLPWIPKTATKRSNDTLAEWSVDVQWMNTRQHALNKANVPTHMLFFGLYTGCDHMFKDMGAVRRLYTDNDLKSHAFKTGTNADIQQLHVGDIFFENIGNTGVDICLTDCVSLCDISTENWSISCYNMSALKIYLVSETPLRDPVQWMREHAEEIVRRLPFLKFTAAPQQELDAKETSVDSEKEGEVKEFIDEYGNKIKVIKNPQRSC